MNASDPYAGRLRVRACGVLIRDAAVLLAKVHSPVSGEWVWIPPGGGVEFGETIKGALVREFQEETGLTVQVGGLLYVHELQKGPFHAIEFYFRISSASGELKLGEDPEREQEDQLLKDLKFIPLQELGGFNLVPKKLIRLLDGPLLNESQTDLL